MRLNLIVQFFYFLKIAKNMITKVFYSFLQKTLPYPKSNLGKSYVRISETLTTNPVLNGSFGL